MVILVSTASLVDRTSVHLYCFIGQNMRTGNTSSGQNICMTGMVIIVSTASLEDRTYV